MRIVAPASYSLAIFRASTPEGRRLCGVVVTLAHDEGATLSPPAATTLTFGTVLAGSDLDPVTTLVIRYAYMEEHDDTGEPSISALSTADEVLDYTREQSASPTRFPEVPPRY